MTRIRDLRKRLELIKNLRQYTMALEIISATRLKKVRPLSEQLSRFCEEMKRILCALNQKNPDLPPPLLVPRNSIQKKGLLVITGDKGHCGVFNSMILKESDKILAAQPGIELILIGDKAISHYQKKRRPIAFKIPKWTRKIEDASISKAVSFCEEAFLEGRLDQIEVLYWKFYGAVRKEIVLETLLPIMTDPPSEESALSSDPLFEPRPAKIYEQLLPSYSFFRLKQILLNSHTWELIARSLAMQMATKNAENLTDTVTLLLNKTRQTEITKEALEIATSMR